MKILAVSLLRMGDLLQQRALLLRLQQIHPGAEIHVLANQSCLSLAPLFPEISKWHGFDRDSLQKALGTAEIPLFAPVAQIEELIQALTEEAYDLVINFTHNRLSAHLISLIPAPLKKGLLAEGNHFRPFENAWLRHFNERFGQKDGTPFHYLELLSGAFGMNPLPKAKKANSGGHRVLIQALTSDEKKNWGLTSWRQFVDRLREAKPELEIKILGASFEKEILLQQFEEEEIEILSWEQMPEALASAALLISGDTSVKHLAATQGLPILELALGSADPRKTGAYSANLTVLHSKIECAPCSHSSPCRKLSHLCAEGMSVQKVVDAALAILKGDGDQWVQNWSDRKDRQIFQGKFVASVGWMLLPEGRWDFDAAVEALDQLTWRLFLDEESLSPVASSTKNFQREVLNQFSKDDVSQVLTILKMECEDLESFAKTQEQFLMEITRTMMAQEEDRISLQQKRRELSSIASLNRRHRRHLLDLSSLGIEPFASPLQFFGAFRRRLDDLKKRIYLKQKMIQQIQEGESIHGQSARVLSFRGPEAT